MEQRSTNKQIANNTIMLYIRMAVIMIVQLYTSRIILDALGISDYGLYNVVGGIVVMFGFINTTLSASTQRYITFELGGGDLEKLKSVFRSSIQLHIIIAILIAVVCEPVGLWLIFNKLQIPEGQLNTTIWVFQISIATFVMSVLTVPYNATIIAHERMSIYAYISVIEVLLKLASVYILLLVNNNRLIIYSLMGLFISSGIRSFYMMYCKKHFEESHYTHIVDKGQLKEMLNFSGWNLVAHIASVLNTQGLNILLNIFFGPTVNAARGIAVQVQVALNQFCTNFLVAVNPELTKSYAAGEYEKSISLMHRASKFGFYLLLMVTLPFFWEADAILGIWLKQVPQDTAIFIKILLLCLLIWAFTNPMTTVAYATGHIKRLNTVCGVIVVIALPISWLVLKQGSPAYSVFLVVLILEIISLIARMIIVRSVIHFSVTNFIKDVFVRSFVVALSSSILPCFLHYYLNQSIYHSIIVCVSAVLSVIISSFYLGMNSVERAFIISMVKLHISKQ